MTKAKPDLFMTWASLLVTAHRADAGERGIRRPRPEALHLARKRLQRMSGLQVVELLLQHDAISFYLHTKGRNL